MLLDHMAGRMSDIEAINGAIPPAGRAVNVQTPFNEDINALVRVKEKRIGVRA